MGPPENGRSSAVSGGSAVLAAGLLDRKDLALAGPGHRRALFHRLGTVRQDGGCHQDNDGRPVAGHPRRRRGGQYDVVKVLDFGLVKAVDAERQTTLTSAGAIAGTPLYLAPEAIEGSDRLDARSDLYAVGAVGYFLLTGTPVFQGRSITEVCMLQVHAEPEPPSVRLGRPVSPKLEALVMACLAKDPAQRPASAEDLADRLAECPAAGTWTRTEAATWWRDHDPAQAPAAESTPTDASGGTRTVVWSAEASSRTDQG